MPIASILGEARQGLRQHDFRGSNFFMPRILNKYRDELGVTALPQELHAAALLAEEFLRNEAATLTIEAPRLEDGRLRAEIAIENRGGHKLPTAYPSRRAWIHFTVLDGAGDPVFESGRLNADGSIDGNDNDVDRSRFEPHYAEISRPDQVQIYEPILGTPGGEVTTVLLAATTYLKDNRILPAGFDKGTADADIAVKGAAAEDTDCKDGGDRVRYAVALGGAFGPFTVKAELWCQPIGFRWARNVDDFRSEEAGRFVEYFKGTAKSSGIVLARTGSTVK